jgi:hypothetical protein
LFDRRRGLFINNWLSRRSRNNRFLLPYRLLLFLLLPIVRPLLVPVLLVPILIPIALFPLFIIVFILSITFFIVLSGRSSGALSLLSFLLLLLLFFFDDLLEVTSGSVYLLATGTPLLNESVVLV